MGKLGKGGGGHTNRVRDKGVHLYKGMDTYFAAYELQITIWFQKYSFQ